MIGFTFFRVHGRSMEPTLHDGDYVLCCTWFKHQLKAGDLVIAHVPEYGNTMVKRVARFDPALGVRLAGDSPLSIANEQLGLITREQIIARVCYCFTD